MDGFNGYLRSLRKDRGLTLVELAQKTGLSHSYISQLERGERGINGVPSPEVLKKLAKPLKVDVLDLMVKAGYMNESDMKQFSSQEFISQIINSLSEEEVIDIADDLIENHTKKNLVRIEPLEKKREQSVSYLEWSLKLPNINPSYAKKRFLLDDFHLFANAADYLKILRIYRNLSPDTVAASLEISTDEYLDYENSKKDISSHLLEWSEKLGNLLKVGDFHGWYLSQLGTAMIDKEGIAEKVILLSDNITVRELKDGKKWRFNIDFTPPKQMVNEKSKNVEKNDLIMRFFDLENLIFLSDKVSFNGNLLSEKDKERALKVLKLVFEEKE